MSITSVNGNLLKKMVTNGAINLKNDHNIINQLNVFPVPDGDTGTNMSMTMSSGVSEMNNCESSSIVAMAKSLSRGLLMGARGNSGVILSQYFRGLYVGMKDLQENELSVQDFVKCLVSGKQVAYKAVMDPVEGTILTVIREAADAVNEKKNSIQTIEELFDIYLEAANKAEDKTPDLLPVLKEAGVKDSGGAGFIKVVEGMVMALKGQMLVAEEENKEKTDYAGALSSSEIKFGYCTEFIIDLKENSNFQESDLRQPLALMGDSLVLVQDENIVKVHVHTNTPGDALTLALKYGALVKVKIENMRLQHTEILKSTEKPIVKKERTNFALISVCFGEGIKNTFKELGVDYIIDGGQTMNPPTEEFVKAINEVNADNVIIIPNNGNVILSAEQSIKLCEGCNVKVLRAKTIAQGYASLMAYDPSNDLDQNYDDMTEAVQNVSSGEITYAVRDTEMNGVKIQSGDYMGILNGKIIVSVKERIDAVKSLIKEAVTPDSAIVTLFVGANTDEDEVTEIQDFTTSLSKDIEIEVIEGKQEIYSYIVSVE